MDEESYKNLIGVSFIVNGNPSWSDDAYVIGDILVGESYDSDGDLLAISQNSGYTMYVFRSDIKPEYISLYEETVDVDSSLLCSLL